jgi:hypothetical protein
LNNVLIDVRRQAVAFLLKIPSPNVPALYMHAWTIFLNCVLGRRACLHFKSAERSTMKFNKKLLHPSGQPSTWRLTHWRESKSNTLYVDLEFGLVPELRIRRIFCFPKSELHTLIAVTFDGQDLLPHTFVGCKHIQEPAFWKHEDPYYEVPCGATSSVNLASHNNSDAKSAGPQPRRDTEVILATCEVTPCLSDTLSCEGSRSRTLQMHRRAQSCGALANTAID